MSIHKRKFVKKNKKNDNYSHIMIYGGSFDPIHLGHLEAIKLALKEVRPSHLFLIPAFRNPFKSSVLFSTKQRVKWIKASLRECVRDQRVSVCYFEINQNRPTPTIHTLHFFQRNFKFKKLSFLLGADNLEHLHLWEGYGELKESLEFVFLARRGYAKIKGYRVLEMDMPISSSQIRQGEKREFLPKCVREGMENIR